MARTALPATRTFSCFGTASTAHASLAAQRTLPIVTNPLAGTWRAFAAAPAAGTATRAPARASTPIAAIRRAVDT